MRRAHDRPRSARSSRAVILTTTTASATTAQIRAGYTITVVTQPVCSTTTMPVSESRPMHSRPSGHHACRSSTGKGATSKSGGRYPKCSGKASRQPDWFAHRWLNTQTVRKAMPRGSHTSVTAALHVQSRERAAAIDTTTIIMKPAMKITILSRPIRLPPTRLPATLDGPQSLR